MNTKIYKVIAGESRSVITLADKINRELKEWKSWNTDLKFDVNKESGDYYFVLTVFSD